MTDPRFGKCVEVGTNTTIDCRGSIGDHVKIGNNVILEGNITIGDGTRIDHGTVIRGKVTIGQNNWIYPYCMLGTGPQHLAHLETDVQDSVDRFSGIKIGDANVIREFVTVHLPINKKMTIVDSNCYIMSYSHVAHDCHVHDYVTMANKVTLGGHTVVFNNANLGFGNNVHPFCNIGMHAMIGMGNNITKDVLPFALINRNQFTKINRIGLQRFGMGEDEIGKIEATYTTGLWQRRKSTEWYAKEIAKFVRRSKRGIYEPLF